LSKRCGKITYREETKMKLYVEAKEKEQKNERRKKSWKTLRSSGKLEEIFFVIMNNKAYM